MVSKLKKLSQMESPFAIVSANSVKKWIPVVQVEALNRVEDQQEPKHHAQFGMVGNCHR